MPREILVPVLPSSADSLTRMLEERRRSHVFIRVPQRGDKRALEQSIRTCLAQAASLATRHRAIELLARMRYEDPPAPE